MNLSTIYALPGILPTRSISKQIILEEVVRIFMQRYPELYTDGSITWVDLYIHTRKAKISRPRMIVISILRATHEWTLWKLGLEFNETNASAYHAMKTVKGDYEANKRYKATIDAILASFYPDVEDREKVLQRMLTIKVEVIDPVMQ